METVQDGREVSLNDPIKEKLRNNRAIKILDAAAKGKYGVPAVVVVGFHHLLTLCLRPFLSSCHCSISNSSAQYNLEGVIATIRAVEKKRSPAMLLLFPWALTYASSHLATLCANAARAASVPITLHMDHAQTPDSIRHAADLGVFDSIMVDMSHHEKAENLALTKELAAYCHERGIAVEAEPGRIEGGEDGVQDTGLLEGMLTSVEEAGTFVATGIDWLAPAFGNVHGNYGSRGIVLEHDRLEAIHAAVGGQVRLVLHGTDGFDGPIYGRCIDGGITKVNINGVVNKPYLALQREGGLGLTDLMEKGTEIMQAAVELCIDQLGSGGKA